MSDSNSQQLQDRGKSALIYAQEGFTAKYFFALLEDSYFGILLSIQTSINEQKLVRNNWGQAGFYWILDFLHIIPFLVHGKFEFKL